MHSPETQELVRELITETDHLSRTWHAANQHTQSGRLAALRSTLQRLERQLGGELPLDVTRELDAVYERIRALTWRIASPEERADMDHLLAHAQRLRAPIERERPSFPLMRVIASVERSQTHRVDLTSVVLAAGTVALLAPLCVPRVRRSWPGWGVVAASVATTSLGLALAVRVFAQRASSSLIRDAIG